MPGMFEEGSVARIESTGMIDKPEITRGQFG